MDLGDLKRDGAGRWFDKVPGADPAWRFRVRGFKSALVQSFFAWRRVQVPEGDREPDGGLGWELNDAIVLEALPRVILLEWEGLALDGVPLPYSPERARELLTDPDYRAFADIVSNAAAMADREESKSRKRLEKN